MIYSLVPGRFQPFHDGHAAIVQKLLDEGKNVCIALRDTIIDAKNPYSITEREAMIKTKFPNIKIITIPDIEEVIYGRDVGWGMREIRLSPDLESISATKIRAQQ